MVAFSLLNSVVCNFPKIFTIPDTLSTHFFKNIVGACTVMSKSEIISSYMGFPD